MSRQTIELMLDRVRELNNRAYAIHQDLEKWRDPLYTIGERTKIGVEIEQCFKEIHKWLAAIDEAITAP